MSKTASQHAPVIIKKYANRRLYNTETSSYITLDFLSAMVKEDREFKVVDAKSGEDITRQVLTQIIVEEESRGQTMLPVSFLRQLIAMYGDNLQSMVPAYLEASMEAFQRNQAQFRKALQGAFSGGPFMPFERIAKQNMAMFEAATEMFRPGPETADEAVDGQSAAAKSGQASPDAETDLKAIREQMAALQAQLEKLAGKN